MKTLYRSALAFAVMACAASAQVARAVTREVVAAVSLVAQGGAVLLVLLAACLPEPVGRWLARALVVAAYRFACFAYDVRRAVGSALFSLMCRTGLILRAFPGTVTADIAFGIVGELAFDGPYRSQGARISHGTAADIVVGRWFTQAADGTVRPGGAGAIGGIFMNPKTQVSLGTAAGGALAPTMTVPTGTIGEFCYMGTPIVQCTTAEAIGQAAWYDTTTGVIGAGAPGGGQAAIPNSKFIRYANAAAGLAVLELTN